MSRIVKRENVHDRRMTKRELKQVAKYPEHVCD